MSSLFTYWEPDAAGQILGTGYFRFETPVGVHGLAQIRGTELDILAVASEQEGKGQFRRFIAAAKERFQSVSVWHDDNPVVGKALSGYGFQRVTRVLQGEKMEGWRWRK